jgi:hypothetical protein
MKIACCLLALLATGQSQREPNAIISADNPVRDLVVPYDMRQPFILVITAEGKSTLQVKTAAAITRTPGWHLLKAKQPVIRQADGRARWEQTFILDALLPAGRHVLQIEPLELREGVGDWKQVWKQVELPPLTVEVTLSEHGALRDLAPIEHLAPAASAWPLVVCSLTLAGGLAAAWLVRRNWRRSAPRRTSSPAERALRELERIRRLKASAARLHTMLSALLRRYLSRRFALSGRQRTTQELRAEIDAIGELSAAQKAALCTFLDDCDLVRFAGADASEAECERRLSWLADFIRQTATDQRSR